MTVLIIKEWKLMITDIIFSLLSIENIMSLILHAYTPTETTKIGSVEMKDKYFSCIVNFL